MDSGFARRDLLARGRLMWWAVSAVVGVVALGYWLVITTEGTYLGTRAVVAMYDWTARRYNRIKNLQFVDEAYFIGVPLTQALSGLPAPRLLDVAAGTGRVVSAVTAYGDWAGTAVGVDRAMGMLREGAPALAPVGRHAALIQGDGHELMFADAAFDAVTCLEALEFMRDPRRVLREMIRVLRPGGVMLVSNRIGPEARLFPRRYARRGRLEALLQAEGMERVDTRLWQTYYDLIWAWKPGLDDGKGEWA